MGAANMRNLMNFPDVEVAALCDVDDNRIPGDLNEVEKKYGASRMCTRITGRSSTEKTSMR